MLVFIFLLLLFVNPIYIYSFSFSGKVITNTNKPIEGIVVNDGINFTRTDKRGIWKLQTDTVYSKHISISIPSEYEIPTDSGLATGFYVSVRDLCTNRGKHNFILRKRNQADSSFYYIVVADPQIANKSNLKRWSEETVVRMQSIVDSLKQNHIVIINTLGDLVFNKMNLYPEYIASCKYSGYTMFQCIGNHDFDMRYQDLHNMQLGASVCAEKYYHQYFGPTDYSYNVGGIHIVTMKNINYVGGDKYIESMTEQQLDWLRKDLSYISKGSTVFLNMHAAGWNTVHKGGNLRNVKELEKVLKGYNVHVFSGHTHFSHNNIVSDSLYEHNIGAVCGTWWSGNVNRCGTPNGFLLVGVASDSLYWKYIPTNEREDKVMRIYTKGDFSTQSDYVVANIWDYDEKAKVVWYEDGRNMGNMERFTDTDQLLKTKKNPMKTNNLFRCRPSDNATIIKISYVNRFGEVNEKDVFIK